MKIKRKLAAGVLLVLLVAVCVAGLVACEVICDHQWGEWVLSADGTWSRSCSLCGTVEVKTSGSETDSETEPATEPGTEPHVHDWTDATCTSPKTCKTCGETEGDALGHSFGAWTVTTKPTCTADGVETRKCANCNETETRKVDALGHKWSDAWSHDGAKHWHVCTVCDAKKDEAAHAFGEWKVTKEPTCTEKGEETRVCACGVKETRPLDAKGHSFGEWTVMTEPTCTADGVETRKCANCNETETRKVDALGHKWSDAWSHDGAKHWHVCTVCDAKKDEAAHAFGEWKVTKEPTCTEKGEETRVCACGAKETRDVAAKGHSFGEWTVTTKPTCTADGVETRKCANCDETETRKVDALGHTWKAATCTEPSTCETCGVTTGDALGHQWGEWKTVADATCEKDGEKLRACGTCGEKESKSIPALGHDWKDATCTEPKHCSRCDATEGNAPGHQYGAWTVKTPATCEKDGERVRVCSVCLKEETERIPATGHTYGKLVSSETLCKAADCEQAALYYESCTVCGVRSEATFESGLPLGHAFDKQVISEKTLKEDATCTTGAVYWLSCSHCGAVSTNDGDVFTDGKTVPHRFELETVCEAALKSAADCTHAAVYYKSCTECGAISQNDSDTFASGDPTGHAFELVKEIGATCTEAGSRIYECRNCRETDTRVGEGALGHNIADVAAVEKETGNACEYRLYYTCQRCGETVEGELVCHHHYIATIAQEATCTTAGKKTYACRDCKATKPDEVIPADGTLHVWVSGEAVDGTRTDTCSACGKTKTVKVYDGTSAAVKKADLQGNDLELNDATMKMDDGVLEKIGDKNVTVSADKVVGDDRKTLLGLDVDKLSQIGDAPIYNFTIQDGKDSYISDFGKDNWVTITLPYTLAEGEDVDSIAIWFINGKGDLEAIDATYSNGYVTFKTNHFSYYTVTRLTPAQRCAKYGHVYADTTVKGDCDHDGYTLRVCVRCHDTVKEVTEPAGHRYTEDRHEATCTEDGYIVYTCSRCNYSYTVRLASAGGHDWEVTGERAATCTEEGFVTKTCKVCRKSWTVQTPKTAHKLAEKAVSATCTDGGYTEYTCDDCGYSYRDAYVPATGHAFGAPVWKWSEDGTSAKAIFTCEHDSKHVAELDASMSTVVTTLPCSDYTVTVITASVAFRGKPWADSRRTELGTPGHVFGKEWKHDGSYHWHECVCGEKSEPIPHAFTEEVTKAPTCVASGEAVLTCECGETKTKVLPATGKHEYVDGVCKVCGKGENDCDHSVLHEKKLNLGKHTSRGDRETVLVYRTCECGEVKILDIEKSKLYCDQTGWTQKTWDDADGTAHVKITGTCPDCGVYYEVEESMRMDGCKMIIRGTFTLTKDGETLLVAKVYEESFDHNGGRVEETIDLTQYGACKGTLKVTKCKSCGEILELDGTFAGIGCAIDFKNQPKPETETDDNGVVHTVMRLVCPDCGLTIEADQWADVQSECVTITYMTLTVRMGDTVIASQEISNYQSKHDWEETYKMDGTTCEDGYTVTQTCRKCGESDTWKSNGHSGENFEIDLSKSGACGGIISGRRCKVCGLLLQMDQGGPTCKFPEGETVTKKIDGIEHQITVSVCKTCGLKMTQDMWMVSTDCEDSGHVHVTLEMDGKVLFDGELVQTDLHHNYRYTYTLRDEAKGCEGGWSYTAVCETCGKTIESSGSGHFTDTTKIDLKETYGICGGYLEIDRCRICGEVEWVRGYDIDGRYCDFERSSETRDVDGVKHRFETRICRTCGFRMVEESWEIPGEGCTVLCYSRYGYYKGDELIVSHLEEGRTERHDYEYSFRFDHEDLGCEGGYTVIRTCKGCGDSKESRENSHLVYEWHKVSDETLGCKREHNLKYGTCPCERYFVYDCNNLEHHWDDNQDGKGSDEGYLYCEDCGLKIAEHVTNKKGDGCTTATTRTVTVSQGDKVLSNWEHTETVQSHNFGTPEVTFGRDGTATIRTSCTACGTQRTTEMKTVTLTKRMEKEFWYYAETELTPKTAAFYTFDVTSYETKYTIMLYREENGELTSCAGGSRFTVLLESGVRYVLRIQGEKEGDTVGFTVAVRDVSDPSCGHEYTGAFAVLADGSTSCEDGVLTGQFCHFCGSMTDLYLAHEHRTISTVIDLTKYQGCYGELRIEACACGKVASRVDYSGCGGSTKNTYTDDDGHFVTVEGRRCAECGMWFSKSWYVVHDAKTCTDRTYYTITLAKGDQLIGTWEYTTETTAHDYKTVVALVDGAKDCEDGVTVTRTCRDCGETYTDTYRYHYRYTKERYDLTEFGSVCGGYAELRVCACGKEQNLELDAACHFEQSWSENWLTSECDPTQEQVGGVVYFDTTSYQQICAVTDPDACGFTVRYATRWVKDKDNKCLVHLEQVWQLGYNALDGTCKREVVTLGEPVPYHDYTMEKTETGTQYNCPNCGSYYHSEHETDEAGNWTERTVAEEKSGYNDLIYWEATSEPDNSYTLSRYQDGTVRTHRETRTKLEDVSFGKSGELVPRYHAVTEDAVNGVVTQKWESIYVVYCGYNFDLYNYRLQDDFWEQDDSTYSFEDRCTRTIHRTRSDGTDETFTNNACSSSVLKTTKEATCTQPGENVWCCPLCSYVTDRQPIEPNHEWEFFSDGNDKWHICLRCGMLNVNGASGDIIMEDLTLAYGKGVNYVVGYYDRSNISFTTYVALILADGKEVVLPGIELLPVEGITAYAFSRAAVAEAAAKLGYKAGSYQVRFVFVPEHNDGNYDYAVTFDDSVPATVNGNTVFSAKLGADETLTFTIEAKTTAEWTLTTVSRCGSLFSISDGQETLLDGGGSCILRLEGGKTYTVTLKLGDAKESGWIGVLLTATATAEVGPSATPEAA